MSENGDSVRCGNLFRFRISENKPLLLEQNADVSTPPCYFGTAVLSRTGHPRTAASKTWISQDLDLLSAHIPKHSLRQCRLYYEDYSLLVVRLVAR